jgi:hypothetical protein
METVLYISKHAFQGDAAAGQLSFPKGEVILYDTRHEQRQGWVWSTITRTSESGWCPLSHLAPQGPTAPPPATPMGNRFSSIGSSIQNAGRNSWATISNGAQKAETIAGGPHKKADNQRDQNDKGPTKPCPGSKPAALRTENEQRAVDVGNFAARGAFVDGVRSAVSNRSLGGFINGAKRGAVTGATWGAVHKWKPFG